MVAGVAGVFSFLGEMKGVVGEALGMRAGFREVC